MYGGQHEEALEKHACEEGKLGKILESKPALTNTQESLWSAFWILNSTRQAGFELYQHLRMVDIMAYATTQPEDPRDFVEIITQMDQAWYKWYLEHREKG